ncbi:MAG: dockerin type I repeat-containing protein, partial [candidate division Zixibacteria bacterium]|nr:dockerin type I repeat-containing protein [candidate division Zixibacteria bacterium]
MFRHFVDSRTGDTVYYNRMFEMVQNGKAQWNVYTDIDSVSSGGDSGHVWFSLVKMASNCQKWWEGERVLLATLTFKVSDTMHVCIDSTFWPPANVLAFTRYDAVNYFPRHNLPFCIWVGPPRIEVISPNGGEDWCVGDSHDITWLSERFTDDVKIQYSTNGGGSWIDIISSTENDGVYPWTVPNTPSTNCLVRIYDAADGDPYDESNAPFTISDESITVTYPNGGEVFVAGVSLSITWNSICFTGTVDIFISEDGGANWDPVVSGTENDGVHEALIPHSYSTDQGLVKVSDSDDGEPSDQSDAFFTVSNFTIRAEPETLIVPISTDTSCTIILESQFGFDLPCTLTLDEGSLPQNTTYDFNPATLVPTDSSILTFHTDASTPPGTSTVIITGTEMPQGKDGIEHSTQVVLIVPPPDFSIEAEPETVTVVAGESIACDVILESIYGFSSPCTLTLEEGSLPANTTYDFNPATVVPTDTSILTFHTEVSTPPGITTIIITGTEMSKAKNGIEHSTQVVLIVTPPPDFTIEAEPETLIVAAGESIDCDIILESLHGFSSACTLTLVENSLPANTTYDFDPVIVVPTDTSVLTFHTNVSTPPGTSIIIITGTEMSEGKNGIEHSTQVVLIIPPADFTIQAEPETLAVNPGEAVGCNVILESLWGFSSPCTLTLVEDSLPANTTYDFNPATVVPTDTSVLTFHTDESTPPGIRTIIITGSEMSGGKNEIEHSTQVVLIVAPPRIVVTSPNGDEHWCVGKTQEITWSSEGVPVPFVKIEYSVNGGTSWETIAENTDNDGTYSWIIPDASSDSCLARVSDAEDGDPGDESDRFFTIFLAGDCTADGMVNIGDAIYLINYFFIGGPPPHPFEAGDVNVDGSVDIADLVYLLNYLFFEGPVPLC